jgi:mannose-6-phosphate isomerase-like protein (cupin superfamily)
MKTSFLMTLALVVLPVLASGEPNFSGRWVRDSARSDVVPNTMYWLTRGVEAGGGRGRNTQAAIEVEHGAGRLEVSDPARPLRTLMLDGKPRTVRTDTGVQMATVTTTMQGDTLTISTTQPFGGMPGNATLKINETWSLSPDGTVLTIRTERDLPALKQTFTEIYNRTDSSARVEVWRFDDLQSRARVLATKLDETKAASETVGVAGNRTFIVAHRQGSGLAEQHEAQADIMMITSGQATMVYGGEIVDGKTTAAGEVRGTSIRGGTSVRLGPGDVLHIPAKTPHQMQLETGSAVTYFVTKVVE